VAHPDPDVGQVPCPDPAHGGPASGGAGSIAQPLARVRLHPTAGEVPAPPAWLSTLTDGAEPRLSRVAALGQTAQIALRLGHASECLAALDEQRSVAGHDRAALVWALTSAAVCRAVLGELTQARADLTQARQTCRHTAPLLAEPFWRFAQVVCDWLAGDWAAAEQDAALLDASQVSPLAPALGGAVTALRTELLRGLGLPEESRLLAEQLAASPPAEISAWALAGLDADQGRPAHAMRRLAGVCDDGAPGVNRAALPLVLHRMAETAFSCGDRGATADAAAALAGLDQAAPLAGLLADLAQAYATGDPQPARHAQQRAEAEGARALAAEALTVRGRIGDAPLKTLSAAHAAWQRIGAPGKAGAVASAMRAAGLPTPPAGKAPAGRQWASPIPAGGPAPLTPRERSLARLVHEGRTNQQIARTLRISVKTVEAYLTRVYRKTSCASRVDLAVAVTESRVYVGE
jgi:DNA-binding CsgD family transcriptional regulator